jgi:hypothetical protein
MIVPAQHLTKGQQVMPPGKRLGSLQMSPAGEKIAFQFLGTLQQAFLDLQNLSPPEKCRLQAKEPQVQGHLIVSAPARMKATSGFTHNLLQAMLNVHMDVFKLIPIGELV